mmetsp:Transcript_134965/g.319944  ORF Transcript_134965/g.319944 Transcript_134965/m.319944 type:complete len:265 (-) Transcript_134965:982-1776(-)
MHSCVRCGAPEGPLIALQGLQVGVRTANVLALEIKEQVQLAKLHAFPWPWTTTLNIPRPVSDLEDPQIVCLGAGVHGRLRRSQEGHDENAEDDDQEGDRQGRKLSHLVQKPAVVHVLPVKLFRLAGLIHCETPVLEVQVVGLEEPRKPAFEGLVHIQDRILQTLLLEHDESAANLALLVFQVSLVREAFLNRLDFLLQLLSLLLVLLGILLLARFGGEPGGNASFVHLLQHVPLLQEERDAAIVLTDKRHFHHLAWLRDSTLRR